jgi:hypothetical protein
MYHPFRVLYVQLKTEINHINPRITLPLHLLINKTMLISVSYKKLIL